MLQHTRYDFAASLLPTLFSDSRLSREEQHFWNMIGPCCKDDHHADGIALRAQLLLIGVDCGETAPEGFDTLADFKAYTAKWHAVSTQCRLSRDDDRRLATLLGDQTRGMFLDLVEESVGKPNKVVALEIPTYEPAVGGMGLHALYKALLDPAAFDEHYKACRDPEWYDPWTLYHFAPFVPDPGAGAVDAESGQLIMDRLGLQKLNAGNGNLLLMYEYLQGVVQVDMLAACPGGAALEGARITAARAAALADKGPLQRACRAGALPLLQLQVWCLAEVAKKKDAMKDVEKAWWVFFLCMIEAAGTPLREHTPADIVKANGFFMDLPNLRSALPDAGRAEPWLEAEPDAAATAGAGAGRWQPRAGAGAGAKPTFQAQGMPLKQAGDARKADTRALEFTEKCFLKCRTYLAHLHSGSDRYFAQRYGAAAPKPVLRNDNIVMLDTRSMTHFRRIREVRPLLSTRY